MNNRVNSANSKFSKLVLILYIAAAVLGVLFIYMFIATISYINNYAASYNISFNDMWMDAIQYIINGSLRYLVYSLLLFAVGKTLNVLHKKYGECHAKVEAPDAESVMANVIEEVKEANEEVRSSDVIGIKVPPIFR